MSFWNIIEKLLLGPLKLVFEVIFQVANRLIGHPGLAIIVLSLLMNILVLPLYKRADAMQEEARDIEIKLKKGVDHIKKSFTGDERMMILQAYYRQNNYKPTDALNGSVSLLLEIPFFMAAYQFLSGLGVMEGVSLGPIADLSKPDGLLVIGSVAINVLPVLMTLVNVISSAIYLKGFPLKTKIQLYGMALFFLVFLYESPACLVFYWTLNNVFSLVKTVFYKLKNPRKVLNILLFGAGLAAIGLCIGGNFTTLKRRFFAGGVGGVLMLPLIWPLVKGKLPLPVKKQEIKPDKALFVMGCIFLTILVGVLIPSSYIAASPQEYVDLSNFYNPLWYILSSAYLAAGTFLVWMGVFYWLASEKGKVIFGRVIWVLCGVMTVNYMFFGTNLGVMSPDLKFLRSVDFENAEQLVNLLVLAAVATSMYLLICKFKKAGALVLLTGAIAIGGMSAVNIVQSKVEIDKATLAQPGGMNGISIKLSRTGKNVIVLMLDRALGYQVPYIFNEKPELQEQFSGFVHYANTLSFGSATNIASPALFGGYEYTPVELNKRDTELLMDKHNEALKVMPKLFSDNDFDVTVIDPPYPNYQWIPDLSVFSDLDGIRAYIAKGTLDDESTDTGVSVENNHRNFFCLSVMKTLPLVLQPTIYDEGLYNQPPQSRGEEVQLYNGQARDSLTTAEGVNEGFMQPYSVLCKLSALTVVTDEETNTFLSMTNDTPHYPMLLQVPEYEPSYSVDNTEYEAENGDRFVVDGKRLRMESGNMVMHYHVNMATMLRLGEWFDFLRENGVYDNTRIILVSDHGFATRQLMDLVIDSSQDERLDLERYAPLLMVKDFDAEGFTTSYTFMTNADVPTLATDGVIENPVNPYTGNPINSDEKTAHPQYVSMSEEFDVLKNNGTTFLPGWWAVVDENIWDLSNWKIIEENMVLDEYSTP